MQSRACSLKERCTVLRHSIIPWGLQHQQQWNKATIRAVTEWEACSLPALATSPHPFPRSCSFPASLGCVLCPPPALSQAKALLRARCPLPSCVCRLSHVWSDICFIAPCEVASPFHACAFSFCQLSLARQRESVEGDQQPWSALGSGA